MTLFSTLIVLSTLAACALARDESAVPCGAWVHDAQALCSTVGKDASLHAGPGTSSIGVGIAQLDPDSAGICEAALCGRVAAASMPGGSADAGASTSTHDLVDDDLHWVFAMFPHVLALVVRGLMISALSITGLLVACIVFVLCKPVLVRCGAAVVMTIVSCIVGAIALSVCVVAAAGLAALAAGLVAFFCAAWVGMSRLPAERAQGPGGGQVPDDAASEAAAAAAFYPITAVNAEGVPGSECVVCRDALVNCTLVPCGHMVCRGCVLRCRAHGERLCPKCRVKIERAMPYLP